MIPYSRPNCKAYPFSGKKERPFSRRVFFSLFVCAVLFFFGRLNRFFSRNGQFAFSLCGLFRCRDRCAGHGSLITGQGQLPFHQLACPNLCTGGENFHGYFEFIPVEDMEKCVEMLVKILTNF